MKKAFCTLLNLFTVIMLCMNLPNCAMAQVTVPYFHTEPKSKDAQLRALESLQLELVMEETRKGSISCFNVRSDGFIIVGVGQSSEKAVYVYNSEYTFQYGYCFSIYGSFGVGWRDNSPEIYSVRGNYGVKIGPSKDQFTVFNISPDKTSSAYWRSIQQLTKSNDGKNYQLESNSPAGFFCTSLTVYDPANGKHTIYESDTLTRFWNSALCPLLICLFIVGGFVAMKEAKKYCHLHFS